MSTSQSTEFSFFESRLYDTALFCVVFFLLGLSLLVLSLPLTTSFQVYLSYPWVLCSLIVCVIFFQDILFLLVDCLSGWGQCMVPCRRQGMLTQGPAADSKCKFNISSFLTLPHPLDCLICAKDIMIQLFLLQIMGAKWV